MDTEAQLYSSSIWDNPFFRAHLISKWLLRCCLPPLLQCDRQPQSWWGDSVPLEKFIDMEFVDQMILRETCLEADLYPQCTNSSFSAHTGRITQTHIYSHSTQTLSTVHTLAFQYTDISKGTPTNTTAERFSPEHTDTPLPVSLDSPRGTYVLLHAETHLRHTDAPRVTQTCPPPHKDSTMTHGQSQHHAPFPHHTNPF
nr:uncharacterized protein LOC105499822 [Macaca nemestrina]